MVNHEAKSPHSPSGPKFEVQQGELTEEEKLVSRETYDSSFKEYIGSFEFSKEMLRRTHIDYYEVYVGYLKEFFDLAETTILLLGVGGGRDAAKLSLKVNKLILVDNSVEFLNFSKSWFQLSEKVEHKLFSIEKLPQSFLDKCSLEGVLAESVFQHLAKDEVFLILERIFIWLKDNGVVNFRLKYSPAPSKLKVTDPNIGIRYHTTWSLAEINQLLTSLQDLGFKILHQSVSDHKLKDFGAPSFYNLVLQKVAS